MLSLRGIGIGEPDAIGSDIPSPSAVITAADNVKPHVHFSWLASGRASGL